MLFSSLIFVCSCVSQLNALPLASIKNKVLVPRMWSEANQANQGWQQKDAERLRLERIIYGGDLTDATAADKARAKAHVGWKHAIVATLDQVHAAHEVEEVQRAVSPHIVLQPLPATESDEDADEYDEADYDNMIDGFVPNAPPFNKPLSMRTALIMAQSYDPSATASEEEKEDHPETQSPDVDTDYDSEILVLTAAEETLVLLRRASNPNHVALDDDSLTLSEEEERWIRLKRAANGRNA